MEKILVTGGTGFVGTALALGLRNMNYEVAVMSTLSNPESERVKSMERAGIEIKKCDVFSDGLNSVVGNIKPDVVIHAAGLAGLIVATGQMPTPADYNRMNVDSTLRMLNVSKDFGVRQFVYLGSAAVYGKSQHLPIDEKHPTNPISPYGISKLEGEKRANEFRSESMRVFIPRIFNAYGPNQTRPEFISQTIKNVGNNEQPVLNGEGKPTRDFIYIDDVVNAVGIGIGKKLDTTLNVATGKETSLLELAELIIKKMGSNVTPKLMPSRSSDMDRSMADVTEAKKAGIEARISIEQGVETLIRR